MVVEELVIELLLQGQEDLYQKLTALETKLGDVKDANKETQQGMDKTASSSKKAGDELKKTADDAKKAGNEIEKAGKKAKGSADLLDKSIARLGKGWTKTLVGYMTGFLMAGTIISTIKGIIGGAMETADAVGKVAEASGQSRKEVYALGKAFESLGQSQESAHKWLTDWNDAQASADVGQVSEVEQAAKTVGIQTRENGKLRRGQDVLIEMGQKAVADSGGDKDLAAKRLQALGIEEQAAKAAVSATKELIAEKEKNNLVTEEQLAKAQEVSAKFKSLKSGAGDFVDAIGMALMPTLGDIIDGVQNVIDFLKGMAKGFEEAGDGAVGFSDVLEVMFAPLKIVIGLVEALLEGLGGVSTWTETGGQIVYSFFTAMQSVWNACIMVVNGLIAALEGLVNAIGMVGHAISNVINLIKDPLNAKPTDYKPIEFGRVSALGGNGKSSSPTWNTNPGRGRIRGNYGLGSGGGGHSGGGRRGGGGGRGGSGGKEEPVYRSRFQGNVDPKTLGIQGAKGRLAEDPVKKAAQEAKRGGASARTPAETLGAGAKQVASASKIINITNSITVNAQGNTNARQIADRTSNAVDMVVRRQAGAMA